MARISIRLSPDELRLVEQVGEGRQRTKDDLGIADRRVDRNKESAEIHKLGFAAELTVAKMLGLEPDILIKPTGNKGISFTLNDLRISVEYNAYSWGDLRFFPGRIPVADLFVLVTGAIPMLHVLGFATHEDVQRYGKEVELAGQGTRIVVSQSLLKPPEELLFRLNVPRHKWPDRQIEAPALRERRDLD